LNFQLQAFAASQNNGFDKCHAAILRNATSLELKYLPNINEGYHLGVKLSHATCACF